MAQNVNQEEVNSESGHKENSIIIEQNPQNNQNQNTEAFLLKKKNLEK